LWSWFTVTYSFAAFCDSDVQISFLSPFDEVAYFSADVHVNIDIQVGEGIVADDIRRRSDQYEMCWAIQNHTIADCMKFASSKEKVEIYPSDLPSGKHTLKAWLKLSDDMNNQGEDENEKLFQSTLSQCFKEVIFYTGEESRRNLVEQARSTQGKIISIYNAHDSQVVVSNADGKIDFVIEIERLVGIRYFDGVGELYRNSDQSLEERRIEIRKVWTDVSNEVKRRMSIDYHDHNQLFSIGIFQHDPIDLRYQNNFGTNLIRELFPSKKWAVVSHHHSHATLGLWDAHFS
jgi:hypothetical protein